MERWGWGGQELTQNTSVKEKAEEGMKETQTRFRDGKGNMRRLLVQASNRKGETIEGGQKNKRGQRAVTFMFF